MSPLPAPEPVGEASALSRLYATNAGQTAIASGATVNPTVTLNSAVGADLAIDGGDPARINVLTSGLYSVIAKATFVTTGGVQDLTEAQLQVFGGPFPLDQFDEFPSGAGGSGITRTLSGEFFIPAADYLYGAVYASRDAAGTWAILSYSIFVQRVR